MPLWEINNYSHLITSLSCVVLKLFSIINDHTILSHFCLGLMPTVFTCFPISTCKINIFVSVRHDTISSLFQECNYTCQPQTMQQSLNTASLSLLVLARGGIAPTSHTVKLYPHFRKACRGITVIIRSASNIGSPSNCKRLDSGQ